MAYMTSSDETANPSADRTPDRGADDDAPQVTPSEGGVPPAAGGSAAGHAVSAPPPLPWMEWTVGERVVVRYRDTDGRPTDALGHLTEVARDHVCVDTKRGNVRVEASTMITGKRVPPAPIWPRP